MTRITQHAAQRYCERINPRLTIVEAIAAIKQCARGIDAAVAFNARVVVQGRAKLIVKDGAVVTVIENARPWSGHMGGQGL